MFGQSFSIDCAVLLLNLQKKKINFTYSFRLAKKTSNRFGRRVLYRGVKMRMICK